MTPLDNLRRLVAGWRGQWRVDAHEGITLSHDGDEWPIGALDGDAVIMLVELLNAIRPAVDGATAEIERLTAELAAARAVPPDVEAAIDARDAEWQNRIETFHQGFDGDGCESGDPIDWTLSALSQAKCTAEDAVGDFIEGHAKRLCDAAGGVWHDEYDSWASQVHDVLNHLRSGEDGTVIDGRASQPATVGEIERLTAELVAERRSDREAVAFANDAAIGDFIDGHAKRLCEQAGEHWTGDGEQLDAWAAKVHDVLNHLRGGEDGAVIDGRASKPATVGELLATAPVGSVVEWTSDGYWHRATVTDTVADHLLSSRWYMVKSGGLWSRALFTVDGHDLRLPARLVPAHLADDDPASRGEIKAEPRCSCTHEAGDSRCDAHPTCSECGDQTARNVDDCADHCQACASLRRGDAISVTSAAAMCTACKARGPIGEG